MRGCWCAECKLTCPLHVLGPLVKQRGPGKKLFPGITAASALTMLREMLEVVGAQDARSYRTHDLRRGHAKDLQVSGWLLAPPPFFWAKVCHIECFAGASLYEILAAGEWRSPAFLTYLDMHRRVLLRVPYVRDKFLSCHGLTGWRPTWSWKLTWKTQNPILNMIDGQVCPVYG